MWGGGASGAEFVLPSSFRRGAGGVRRK